MSKEHEPAMIPYRNPETGLQMHIPRDNAAMREAAEARGLAQVAVMPDGFRKREKRPKGWAKQAIKDGVIADPDDPHARDFPVGPDTVVFDVPTATLTVEGKTPR